jgi:CrcB protein
MGNVNLAQLLAVIVGAALGGVTRWRAGLLLNPMWHGFPLGTLAVNCVGGLLAGMGLVYFQRSPNETLRLLCVVGFLGGLTTFSSFSAESLALLLKGRFELAALHTFIHVFGSLAAAAAGARWMRVWLG